MGKQWENPIVQPDRCHGENLENILIERFIANLGSALEIMKNTVSRGPLVVLPVTNRTCSHHQTSHRETLQGAGMMPEAGKDL